jgi:nitroreductase
METEKAILGRRSVREYADKAVPRDAMEKILRAGAMAPSAMGVHPCRFIVITDRKLIRELSGKVKAGLGASNPRFAERMKAKEDPIFYDAPLLVLIVADKSGWAATDCALAAQNMFLQAYDLGLGSCFIGLMVHALGNDRETLRTLGVLDSQELFCPLIFGYPKEWPPPKVNEVKVQKKL